MHTSDNSVQRVRPSAIRACHMVWDVVYVPEDRIHILFGRGRRLGGETLLQKQSHHGGSVRVLAATKRLQRVRPLGCDSRIGVVRAKVLNLALKHCWVSEDVV